MDQLSYWKVYIPVFIFCDYEFADIYDSPAYHCHIRRQHCPNHKEFHHQAVSAHSLIYRLQQLAVWVPHVVQISLGSVLTMHTVHDNRPAVRDSLELKLKENKICVCNQYSTFSRLKFQCSLNVNSSECLTMAPSGLPCAVCIVITETSEILFTCGAQTASYYSCHIKDTHRWNWPDTARRINYFW